ncbi:MAG: methyltransferase [Lentimicrobiaceae bacterium]|jgi:tRNA1Val (adenine37-N6)-methyltransferase|nr:methyltransferase [Lentimicrobiaceae bacterium]
MGADSRPFHFKHFSLFHHRSTMKIGTDAILLAAWIQINTEDSVLDIGTGSGIISLMLSQRGVKNVDAVEIDYESASEAQSNFEISQWRDSLQLFHADIKDFASKCVKKYDLIVSNPPFFTSTFKTNCLQRNLARHTDTLNFEELIHIAKTLLTKNGRFAVVLPLFESKQFLEIAAIENFFVKSCMQIFPVAGKEANRTTIELVQQPIENPEIIDFTIRNTDRSFTEQYNTFLRDFYLGL